MTTPRPATDPSRMDDNVIGVALGFLHSCLDDMPARLAAIEAAAGEILNGGPSAHAVVVLQDIDRLRQEAAGLARFAHILLEDAAARPGTATMPDELREALMLGDLQARLAATIARGTDPAPVTHGAAPTGSSDARDVLF